MKSRIQSIPPDNPQIYRQDDDGYGKPRYYYIGEMVAWAHKNLELSFIRPDNERALKMIENGDVDPEYIMNHTLKQNLSPIVICKNAHRGKNDQIVDGNHRYVAFCYAAENSNEEALLDAYVIEPQDWVKFVVPPHIVPVLALR